MSDMSCAELVELVTEYFEDQLSAGERERIREHLLACDGCAAHVEQMRAVVRVAATLPPEGLSRQAEEKLVGLFRSWAAGRPGR